jgi:hypothetical protein
MSPIVDGVRRPAWPQRLMKLLDRFGGADRLPAGNMSGIDHLTDRQLRDIGLTRPDIGRQINRDMEELRRKGVGPFV